MSRLQEVGSARLSGGEKKPRGGCGDRIATRPVGVSE